MSASRTPVWSVPAVASVVLLALSWWTGTLATDDGFVDLQVARHVARGDGFVFTTGGEPTECYSSLLWMAMNAVLFRTGLDPRSAAVALAAFFGILCVWLLWDVSRRRAAGPLAAALPVLALATAAPFVVAARTMGDATLFAALLLAGVWSVDRLFERPSSVRASLAAACALLVALSRFEGLVASAAVVAALAVLARERAHRSRGAVAIAIVAIGVIAYHAWRVASFHALVPASFLVHAGLNRGVAVLEQPHDLAPYGAYYLIIAILGVAAFAQAPRNHARVAERTALAVALCLGALDLLIVDKTPGLANHACLVPLFLVPWAGALKRLPQPASAPGRVARAAVGVALLSVAIGAVADLRATVRRFEESNVLALRPMGEWLAGAGAGSTLATDAVGAITYYADAPALDMRGGATAGAADVDRLRALVEFNPDVIIMRAHGMFEPEFEPDVTPYLAYIQPRYRVLAAIRTAWRYDQSILVHVRRDIPEFTEEELATFPEGIGSLQRLNR